MDEEERNYCCLVLLLLKVANPRLRLFFKNQWDAAAQRHLVPWSDCAQNGADLLRMFKPHPYDKDKVKSGDTSTWDLSLFVQALIQSRPPFVTAPDLVTALKTLRDMRNQLCHSPDPRIKTSDFQKSWDDACKALTLFGAAAVDFDEVKDDVQKPWSKLFQVMKDCADQDKAILDALDPINKKIKQLQHGQKTILEGQSTLQQRQNTILQELSALKRGQEKILDSHTKDDIQTKVPRTRNSNEDSEKLKEAIKSNTEYLPKIMASHDILSARTDDIFTNLTVYYDMKQRRKGQVKDLSRSEQLGEYSKRSGYKVKKYIDIFINTVGNNPKRILLIGKPGVGKSLLCLKIPRDWAYNNLRIDIQFVYLLTFRQLEEFGDKELNFRELLNCSSLLDEHSIIDDSLFEYLMKNPSKVLIILDGYDEYSKQHREEISDNFFEQKYSNNPRKKMPVPALCSKLIKRKIFRDSFVLVSSRPGEAEELGEFRFDRFVEIAGFSSEQVTEFVEKYFSKAKEETKKTVREHIENNENLVSFCHIPLLCWQLCWCLELRISQSGNAENLPAKKTDLYGEVVQVSLEKLHANLKYAKINEPVEKLAQETLTKLEQLSGYLLEQEKIIFTEEDMKNLSFTQDEIENLKISGLLHSLPATRISARKVKKEYTFTHLTFKEYLSACLFVKRTEVPDTNKTSSQTLVFMSGLLSREKDDELMKNLLEKIKPQDYQDNVNKLLTLQCLYEYGYDDTMIPNV